VVEAKLVVGRVRVVFDRGARLTRTVHRYELTSGLEQAPEPAPKAKAKAKAKAKPAPKAKATPKAKAKPAPKARPKLKAEPAPPSADLTHPQLAPADAWQTMEALRLGVVPARGVRAYTVARDKELADIDAVLAEGQGCRVVWGDYGAGKTHLLDAAEQLGLERGFAVARMTLDPREQAMHKPLRLYRAIMNSVRTRDSMRPGFESLLEPLKDSPEHYRPGGEHFSRFFSPYLHATRSGEEVLEGWLRDYVRGDNVPAEYVNMALSHCDWRGPRVLAMPDYRTYGRMYIHLIGTLACWIKDAGAKGLLLVFDEVERVDALRREDQGYAFQVLRHYTAATMLREDLAFDPDRLYRGGAAVHRDIPLQFREQQPLVSLFALTPLEEITERFHGVTLSHAYDIVLGPLRSELLPELVERVGSLYASAYPAHRAPVDLGRRIVDRIRPELDGGHDSFRDAVRATVFLHDEDRLRRATGDAE